MPSIDVYADNESVEPEIILFHNENIIESKLQRVVVENLDVDIEAQVYSEGEEEALAEQYGVSRIPTTLLIGEFGVLGRWAGVTHESDILPVIERKT